MNKVTRLFQGTITVQQPGQRLTCFIFAGLVAAMPYVFAITGASFQQLVILQVIFIVWVIFALLFRLEYTRFPVYGIFAWWVLGFVLILNLAVNSGNYTIADKSLAFTAAHIAGILAFSFAAQWAASNLQPDRILEYMAWMLMPIIIWALVLGWARGGSERLEPLGIHPNWWGEMAFGFVMCVLAVKKAYARVAFIMIGLALMHMVQSRGALFAALVSVLSYWFLQHRPFGKIAMRRFMLSGAVLIGSAVLMVIIGWWPKILVFVEQRILLLNDPYRGLGTGFTGRIEGWLYALEIFLGHPVFGQGFDTLADVHNGFLRFAAEGGILLLGVMTVMIILALVHAWRQRNDLVVAALLGSIVYLMTYPRGLNLNIAGIVFLLSLFPWKWSRPLNGSTRLGR